MRDVFQHPYYPCLKALPIASSLQEQWNNPFIFCKMRWILSRKMNRVNRKNQLLASEQQSISSEHGLGTWLALTEEIHVASGGLPPICAEYGLETRLSPTERNRELVVSLHPNWTENEHETWLATNDEIPVYAIDVQPILLNIASKHDSLQAKNLVYCISTYSLSVVKMCTKHDWRQITIIVYWRSSYNQYVHETWLVPTNNFLSWS